MLLDSRIAGFSGNFSFTRPRWLFSFGMGFVSNMRRNMLFYSVLQSLGGAIQKDCVPATQKSSVVYEFTCQCDSGRTTQRLEDRIKQHVPSHIRNKTHPKREQPSRSCKTKITTKTCDSAIGQHLLENPDCAKNYNGDMFRIIGKARSSFHLAVLESIYISTKKPLLCRHQEHQEFVFTLGLHW